MRTNIDLLFALVLIVVILLVLHVVFPYRMERFVVAKPARPIPSRDDATGWQWRVYGTQLVLVRSPWTFTIGAGGCIYQIWAGKPLLGPDTVGSSRHDRVIQAVTWAIGTLADPRITFANDYDRRWNVNQGGGWVRRFAPGNAVYSEIMAVELNPTTNVLEVWCRASDQFQPALANHFQSSVPQLTRMTPMANGFLMIERFILYGMFSRDGQRMRSLRDIYLEQWSGCRMDSFTSAAWGGIDINGNPRNVYSVTNVPDYQSTPASQTTGSVALYGKGDCLALMFNRGARNVLNGRSYPTANVVALCPASDIGGDIIEGSIVYQALGVCASKSLQEVGRATAFGQPLLKETTLYPPGVASVSGLSPSSLARLRGYVTAPPGIRTYNLGSLLKSLEPSTLLSTTLPTISRV